MPIGSFLQDVQRATTPSRSSRGDDQTVSRAVRRDKLAKHPSIVIDGEGEARRRRARHHGGHSDDHPCCTRALQVCRKRACSTRRRRCSACGVVLMPSSSMPIVGRWIFAASSPPRCCAATSRLPVYSACLLYSSTARLLQTDLPARCRTS